VLDTSLRLLHPFTPFVTEELWGHLRLALIDSPLAELAKDWTDVLIVARWPEPQPQKNEETETRERFDTYALKREHSIRNARAEKKIDPHKLIPSMISGPKDDVNFIKGHIMASGTVSGLDEDQLQYFYDKPPEISKDTVVLFTGSVGDYLILNDFVDQNKERSRLEKELKEVQSHIERLEKLLSSDFANKAPAAVVQKERDKLSGYKETAEKLKSQLK